MSVYQSTGPILEETHYYPYGLVMAGISTVAPLKLANKYKYNGKLLNHNEFSDGTGLEWYSYGMREYDPQIGRFPQLDPLTDEFAALTPYQYASNDPIANIDLDGLEGVGALGGLTSKTWQLSEVVVTAAKPISTSAKIIRPISIAGKVENLTSLALHGAQVASDLLNSAITATEVGNIAGHILPTVTITVEKTKYRNYNIADARNGLQVVYNKYGMEMATNVERIYRMETSHFRSLQYKRTGTGGMEVHGPAPNYGWNRSFFSRNPQYAPIGIYSIYEGKGLSASKWGNKQVTSKPKQFLIMPSVEAGMMYLSDYIINHNGNYARWYSTNPSSQEIYRQRLLKIIPRITNTFKKTSPNVTLLYN